MSTVSIRNVGAIKFVDFQLVEGEGGVRIVKGANGKGKTTLIACLSALLGRKVPLSPTEGAPFGEIDGLGVRKTIKKKVTSHGQPDVDSLECRFDFSDLVDPPLKSEDARNRARIKALIGLTSEEASVEDFYELVGGREPFEQLVGDRDLEDVTDILDLAAEIKKILQGHARLAEARQPSRPPVTGRSPVRNRKVPIRLRRHQVSQRLRTPTPKHPLRQAAEKTKAERDRALSHNARLQAQIADHDKLKPAYDEDSVLAGIRELSRQISDINNQIRELEAKRSQLQVSIDELDEKHNALFEWSKQRRQYEGFLVEVPGEPPAIAPLKATEAKALEALENAEEAKARYEAAVKAVEKADEIRQQTDEANRFRTLAGQTDAVVMSKLPKDSPFQVVDGVLCAEHPHRGLLPFENGAFSEGQRWKLALEVAVKAVGEGGVIPCDQEAWQALDTKARDEVAQACREARVYLITGQVDDGELRVEAYGSE